jgi:hypothetical protein
MANESSKSGVLMKQATCDSSAVRTLATCKVCNQDMRLTKWTKDVILAVCINPTCSRFMTPIEPMWIVSDVKIDSAAPEDGYWETRIGQMLRYSEMDQSHLAAALRMMYRNPGWRLQQIKPLINWAKYRGVQFDGEFRALAQSVAETPSKVQANLEQIRTRCLPRESTVPPV